MTQSLAGLEIAEYAGEAAKWCQEAAFPLAAVLRERRALGVLGTVCVDLLRPRPPRGVLTVKIR